MVDENCVFCRIIGGEEMVSLVHEDDHALAFLDIQPANPGHTLVVSRQHYPTFFDVPDEVMAHCMRVSKRLGRAVRRATNAAALNLFSANGRVGGQDVPHFHLHLVPVNERDDFPLHFPLEDAAIPSRSELDTTAARIGRAIQAENSEQPLAVGIG